MTTLVALNTRDALVIGCDSLGTITRVLVDPSDLEHYFDPSDDLKVRTDKNGRPLLSDFGKIYEKARHVPYDHMTHVDKLFSLYPPLEMGVMCAGLVAIRDSSIKNLIGEFKSDEWIQRKKRANYTLKSIGERLLQFMWSRYSQEYPDERRRPELELMLGGYDRNRRTPGVVRIKVHKNEIGEVDYGFGIYFGGQMEEIQRLVFGTDYDNKVRLILHTQELLKRYHALLSQQLKENNIQLKLKTPDDFGNELYIFNDWDLEGLDASWGAFSEQNAIECVDFMVGIMIRSHQFCSRMPTVGAPVQIAVIKKGIGFTFVSRREWRHGDYAVPAKE